VYNKIDKLDRQPRITNNRDGEGRAVWLSAITGEGIPMLKDAIARRLRQKTVQRVIHLLPGQGRQRAKLFELGAVSSEELDPEGGWTLELKMTEKDLRRFLKRENLAEQNLGPLSMKPSATAANE
jgi:GTP-binding protein HflX